MRVAALRTMKGGGEAEFIPRKIEAEAASTFKTSAARLREVLGWIGVGIGVAELLRPRAVAHTTGLPPRLIRVLGTWEIIISAGILLRPQQSAWRWSRVASDIIDLYLLTRSDHRALNNRLPIITALFAGMTSLDVLAAFDGGGQNTLQSDLASGIHIHKSLHIQKSAEECYRFWRNFENFPKFMRYVDSVQVVDATHTHWRFGTQQGPQIEETIELFSDVPTQQLGWRTLPNSPIEHIGVVKFLPAYGKTSTRLDIEIIFKKSVGKINNELARLFAEEPSAHWDEDLRRFKQLIETGEIATTMGQASGRRSALPRLLHREGKS